MGLESRQPATDHLVGTLPGQLEPLVWANLRRFGMRSICALALVAATTAVILALAPVVDFRHTLAIYFIPVVVATLWWDFAIGLVTALASALAAAFFFFDPIFSFYVANPAELVGLLIFAAAAIVIGYLATELREARRAALTKRVTESPAMPSAANGASQPVDAAAGDGHPSSGTVPERVKEFIIHSDGATFCDGCIQDRLGLKWRQQVQLITATLAVTDSFARAPGHCSSCAELKQVIRAVGRNED
jgi:Domain of unknown function (DUF4118)